VIAATEGKLPERLFGIRIRELLGEGGRSIVYGGQWQERDVALKVYKPRGIENHQKRHHLNIAEFEYRRNKAIFETEGLSRYIAQPLHFITGPDGHALVQERLKGPLYYFYYRKRSGRVPTGFRQHLENIITLAHDAGIYDVDIHAFNVIVDESGDEPIPKLFDFNLIPFHERPGVSISKVLLMLGITNKTTRDKRLLKNFDKIARRERKLVKYFE
jgi:RIO-like serine/threonine protein kinase